MNLTCPYCRSAVPIADVNVATDIALCRQCGRTFSFSENIPGPAGETADAATPPVGAWVEQLPSGFRLGASTRSWLALFLVPFTCVWAGGALGGIYGGQLKRGHWQLFPSLFGLPFLLGSCALIVFCAMLIAGKIELTKNQDRLYLFMGVGILGWSRAFLWTDFIRVREENRLSGFSPRGQGQVIVLEGKRRVAFGSMLNEEKRYFLVKALRSALREQAAPNLHSSDSSSDN